MDPTYLQERSEARRRRESRPQSAPERTSWACSCEYYHAFRFCAHTIALDEFLEEMGAPS